MKQDKSEDRRVYIVFLEGQNKETMTKLDGQKKKKLEPSEENSIDPHLPGLLERPPSLL